MYAGANRPLYLIRNGELIKYKGTKSPIGGGYQKAKGFEEVEIALEKGDSFYMFSDGYPDQFGGPKGKKFMVKQFGELLLKVVDQAMEKQHKTLALELEKWQGDQEPVDDVLVIGIRV